MASLLLAIMVAGCSNHTISKDTAQQMIEMSARFKAAETVTVRARYCATGDPATDNAGGFSRLSALESEGAVHIERRPAAAGECTSLPPGRRQRLDVSLTDSGASFHPEVLDNAIGWNFTLAHRRFVGVKEITYNQSEDSTIARVLYQWAWHDELIGQLLSVSEEPVNAVASFSLRNSEWALRDIGF
ncbi:MAG TPA: hypothetical protein VL173_17145 [Vicinamibacterales bacterium]|nr:hypothetical protein [Vicinamibacterales bacterium]